MTDKKEKNKGEIIIIDDDMFLLDMYSVKFNEKGYEVIPALGSMEALDKLRDGLKPKVILLDIVMPDMDGFELLKLINTEKLAEESKIIVLSNLGQESDIEKGTSLGAHGYIVKASATPSEVVEKVEAMISN